MDTMATGEQIMSELMGPGYLERRAEQRNGFNGVSRTIPRRCVSAACGRARHSIGSCAA